MSDNPFAAPVATTEQPGDVEAVTRRPIRRDLFTVALLQKLLLLCIAFHVVVFVIWVVPLLTQPRALGGVVSLTILPLHVIWGRRMVAALPLIVAWVLAFKVYRSLTAIGMCLLTMVLTVIPTAVLIPLICISSRASRVISRNGFKVGWLGANLAEVRATLREANSSADNQ